MLGLLELQWQAVQADHISEQQSLCYPRRSALLRR